MAEPSDQFQGYLTIVWPKPGPTFGELIELFDADTGQRITSVLDMKIHASPGNIVTAELLMLVNEQGAPLPADATPIPAENGEGARTGTFRWLVTEMRATSREAP
jgi:hypothetical protein